MDSLAYRRFRCIFTALQPIVDEQVHAEWGIPAHWKLRAQLVFGSVEGEAKDKDYIDDATRFKVFQ